MTYTSSGIYTAAGLNAAGCTLTSTLDLTINSSSSSSQNETACDSYTWPENNETYTVSGNYASTSMNAAGCVHTSNLNLVINNSSSSAENQTACDSYTWNANGMTYNNSGTYTTTSTNSSGCLHTSTLILTINSSSSSNQSETACDSYTWSVNNMTYTSSGIYTATGLNAAGCTLTSTVDLTINSSSSSSQNETACDSYTWLVNNETYTVSGTYTSTSLNASGCQHTSVLNLVINYSSSSTQNITACESYTWAANNTTYSLSGTYTSTSTNADGCMHTSTLNIILNPTCDLNLNLKFYIQGYYDAAGMMHPVLSNQGETANTSVVDSFHVELRDPITYNVIASGTGVLNTNGTSMVSFPNTAPGIYYIAITHRNAIQTWSANPVILTQNYLYDFSTSDAQAYGSNMIQVGSGIWAFYSGELNADDNIAFGYQFTDVNGDGNVDLLDNPIVETNVNNFIFSAHP
jgi:hypothetical protein